MLYKKWGIWLPWKYVLRYFDFRGHFYGKVQPLHADVLLVWGFNNKIFAPKKWFSKNVGNIVKYEVNTMYIM